VSICGRNEETLNSSATELTTLAGDPTHILARRVELSSRESVEAWIAATVEHFGRLDGAVNNAGQEQQRIVPLSELDDDTWSQAVHTNLDGMMFCVRAELAHLGEGGSIVNVASLAAHVGLPHNAAYSATKHGVLGLTRAVAREVGPRGIRVNCLSP
jgi:NAD(P)-dependent dehydrogenase (short-subunit alcohol dehydrogenase family)